MNGIVTRNVSIDCADAAKPVVSVELGEGKCEPLETFCRKRKLTPVQFLPIDAQRWPGCFVGVFAPTVYVHGTRN